LRRLGVPALWPSRVKVVALALVKSTVIVTVLQYLSTANVSYLDLRRPAHSEIHCHLPSTSCVHAEDPVKCILELDNQQWMSDLLLRQPCPFRPAALGNQVCTNVSMPLEQAMDHVSLRSSAKGLNALRLWSWIFLIFVIMETFLIMLHDLILIHEPKRFQTPGYNPRHDKHKILTLYDLKSETPCLWKCIRCLCASQIRRPSDSGVPRRRLLNKNTCFNVVVRPLIWFVRLALFIVVTFPYIFLSFPCFPRRMSRLAVFGFNIMCMVTALSFVAFNCYENMWQQVPYVLLWNAEVQGNQPCVCSCDFPFKHSVNVRFVVLGFTVFLNSVNLAMLTLKGLRWAHWANMISVLYPVPIGTFPVEWERPTKTGGGPVRWRDVGDSVQGEPAFDPFCLMDEQPESNRTRPGIAPMKLLLAESFSERSMRKWERLNTSDDEGIEVGCCGFPTAALSSSRLSSAMASLATGLVGDESSSDEDLDGKTPRSEVVGGRLAEGPSRESRFEASSAPLP